MPEEALTSITIKGFKSIRSLDQFPLRRFNVMVGANGAGKSNFIDFFRLLSYAFRSTQGGLQLFAARKGRASSLLHYGPRVSGLIDAELKFERPNEWSRYAVRLVWGAPDELTFASEVLEYQRTGTDLAPRRRELGSGRPESGIHELAISNERIAQEARVFLRRLRNIEVYHFHDTSEQANIRLTQDMATGNRLLSHAGNLAAFLFQLKENEPKYFGRILSTVQLVAPYIKDLVLEPQLGNDRFILLRWMDRSGEVFGPHQLSDGTLRAIALITALRQPPASMPGIVIVDEPELGLHPSAISLIADLLKSASETGQVIVATQSPLLIREYNPDDLVVVERIETPEGRGESTFTRLDPESLEAWLEDYDLGELYEKNVTGGYPQ